MRRTPIARTAPLRSGVALARKGIRRGPSKRLVQSLVDYAAARAVVWARDHGLCVRCGARGDEFHHRQPRGMGGASRDPDAHKPSRLIVVCRVCHAYLESNRQWAYTTGLLVRHGLDPAAVWLVYRGLQRWLTDDGQVLTVLHEVDAWTRKPLQVTAAASS